ncbi:MAG: histidine kinase [Rhodoferax sp.]|jgi:two-component system sensor histidine kinase AlgZ|nr:histidine kinase [Rhodoferax sp.]
MKDTEILSTFQELDARAAAQGPQRVLVFDACQLGVVLRAVLFVEAVGAIGAMFGAASVLDWVVRLAVLTAATLPATLAWLIVACTLKRWLGRWPEPVQVAAGMVLGALAGLYGCGMLFLAGLAERPPWVASGCAGAALAAALVAALVLRARGRAPAATAARLSELQSRIRPHFLFNTLNSAIALVRAEPAKAETLLEDLSDLFRHALIDQGESVTLDDEIALAQRYLAIEQVRFGERLQTEWALDPKAGHARLPPLLLQPLVENAVRHGVEPSETGATVRISTQRRGSVVLIKVTNTVPAGAGSPGHGVALDNVRDRLRLLHDVQGQFRSGLVDGVYQVRIEVPA